MQVTTLNDEGSVVAYSTDGAIHRATGCNASMTNVTRDYRDSGPTRGSDLAYGNPIRLTRSRAAHAAVSEVNLYPIVE